MELDYLVDILKGTIDKNIIVNMGKEGKESFNLITDFNMDIENAITDSTDNLQKFIHEEFYVTLINRIKSEVQMAINEHTLLNEKTTNPLSDKSNIISSKDDSNVILINNLKLKINMLTMAQ